MPSFRLRRRHGRAHPAYGLAHLLWDHRLDWPTYRRISRPYSVGFLPVLSVDLAHLMWRLTPAPRVAGSPGPRSPPCRRTPALEHPEAPAPAGVLHGHRRPAARSWGATSPVAPTPAAPGAPPERRRPNAPPAPAPAPISPRSLPRPSCLYQLPTTTPSDRRWSVDLSTTQRHHTCHPRPPRRDLAPSRQPGIVKGGHDLLHSGGTRGRGAVANRTT